MPYHYIIEPQDPPHAALDVKHEDDGCVHVVSWPRDVGETWQTLPCAPVHTNRGAEGI